MGERDRGGNMQQKVHGHGWGSRALIQYTIAGKLLFFSDLWDLQNNENHDLVWPRKVSSFYYQYKPCEIKEYHLI